MKAAVQRSLAAAFRVSALSGSDGIKKPIFEGCGRFCVFLSRHLLIQSLALPALTLFELAKLAHSTANVYNANFKMLRKNVAQVGNLRVFDAT